MNIGFVALTVCAAISIAVVIYQRFVRTDYRGIHDSWSDAVQYGGFVFTVSAAVVLAVWLVAAVPVSNIERTSCEREAAGYGLDYDWSFRNSCRVQLPTGQLVPSNSTRITSDGEIIKDAR